MRCKCLRSIRNSTERGRLMSATTQHLEREDLRISLFVVYFAYSLIDLQLRLLHLHYFLREYSFPFDLLPRQRIGSECRFEGGKGLRLWRLVPTLQVIFQHQSRTIWKSYRRLVQTEKW